jgi:peptidoglycan/LPS O-acetylase OafA/YrhL
MAIQSQFNILKTIIVLFQCINFGLASQGQDYPHSNSMNRLFDQIPENQKSDIRAQFLQMSFQA